LRQAVNALLAVPIGAAIRAGTTLRQSVRARAGIALGLALVLGTGVIGVIGAGQPAITVATLPQPILPLTQAAFATAFSTDRGLSDSVAISFTAPMDARSVAAAVTVEPPAPVDLAWNATGTVLTISPRSRWPVGALNTVTVGAGALARSGQPLARSARAVFVTRDAATGSIAATAPIGARVSTVTSFEVAFDGPVDPDTVADSVALDPPTPGSFVPMLPGQESTSYLFIPATALRADTAYRVTVAGVRDLDGLPLDAVTLHVRTAKAPAVVRFGPSDGGTALARQGAVSLTFTEAMDRASTARALKVALGGRAIAGKIGWLEHDTVLTFSPSTALPFDTPVSIDLAVGATSASGIPLDKAAFATLRTVKAPPPPKPAPPPDAQVDKAPASISATGGAAVGGGSWAAVERYYLGLMNCTRTGGWVTATGKCSSPGGRNVAALKLDSGISSKVSRPYARKIAISGDCAHFVGSTPATRLRRAGYTSYRWAENLGCRSGNPFSAVLGSHLFFQAEKPYLGGHYVNLMNAKYDRVGIGVWVSGGRVRLVVDFYHP
jgi:hypothetical protein